MWMIQLRDYQQELIDDVRKSYLNGSRAPCVVLGCGGGKTVLFAYMAQQSQEKGITVWFLVHRLELLVITIDNFDMFNIEIKKIKIIIAVAFLNKLYKYFDTTLNMS